MVVGRVADDDAAAAGNTFQPAGEVHFAPENGVIQNVRVRAHQSDGRQAGIDAGAKLQRAQWRLGRHPGGKARAIFGFAHGVLRRPSFIQIMDGALRVNRGPHAIRGVFFVWRGRAPKRHDTVANVFVERATVLFYRVGDSGKVKVYRFERLLRGFFNARFRHISFELVLADEIGHALLHFIGQRGESADIRKKYGHFTPRAAEGKPFRVQQFIHHIR